MLATLFWEGVWFRRSPSRMPRDIVLIFRNIVASAVAFGAWLVRIVLAIVVTTVAHLHKVELLTTPSSLYSQWVTLAPFWSLVGLTLLKRWLVGKPHQAGGQLYRVA